MNRTVICVWEYPRHKLPSRWVLSILPWCKYPPFLQQHRAGQSHHHHLALSVRAPHYRHPTEWTCGSLHIIRCTQLAVWQPDFPFYACYCASRWLWKRCQTVTHSHIWLHLSCHHLPRANALLCVLHTNPGTLLENPTCKPFWIIKQNTRPHSTALLVLILCGDIQTNPGPRHSCGSARAHLCPRSAPLHSIYPCGYYQKPVTWSTPSVCGGYFDVWFHAPCVDLSQSEYTCSVMSHSHGTVTAATPTISQPFTISITLPHGTHSPYCLYQTQTMFLMPESHLAQLRRWMHEHLPLNLRGVPVHTYQGPAQIASQQDPLGYKGFCRDRNANGGGVMVMIRESYIAEKFEIWVVWWHDIGQN